MRHNHWITATAGALLTACATASPPSSTVLVESHAAVRVAEQNGAESDPRAAQYLAIARQQIADAEQMSREGSHDSARRRLEAARINAELAGELAAKGEAINAQRDAQARTGQLARSAEEVARAAEQARARAEAALAQLQAANDQVNAALAQLQGAIDEAVPEPERAAAERDANPTEAPQCVEIQCSRNGELEKLESELTEIRRQLAQKGAAADDATGALEDRAVALQAQIDVLSVEGDRAQKERDRALEAIRELASVSEKDSRGLVITMPAEIMFRPGSAKLLPRSRAKLDDLATALARLGSDQQFVIEGHTDSRGGEAANERLSKRRALAVRAFLIEQGVDGDRVVARGKGEDEPVASNATTEGRAENRRVEIVVTPSIVSER